MRGILNSLFGPSASSVDRSPWSDYWYRPVVAPTHAGIDVDEDVALTYSTVYACVSKIAKTIATLPAHVYRHLPDGKSEPAPDHWLQRQWTVAPNPEMSAVSAREAFMANTLAWGNGILEIQETVYGEPAHLWPLLTRFLTLKRDDNDVLYFEYSLPGEEMRILRFDQVVNLAAFSTDGIVGRTPIQVARESVALGLAARQHQSAFIKNGATPSLVLRHPGIDGAELSEPAAARLINSFNEHHQSSANAGKPILLEEGVEVQLIGMSFKDAQYLELRQFERGEICGMYDTPLSKIQDDTRATFSNIEQKNIDWVTDCILPWCVRIETVMNNALLDGGREYYLKHELTGLLRGDMAARSEFYNKMIRVGMSPNEILKLEDLNGIGPEGDRRFVSADLVPLDKIDEVIESKRPATGSPPSEPKEPGDREDALVSALIEANALSNTQMEQFAKMLIVVDRRNGEGNSKVLEMADRGRVAGEAAKASAESAAEGTERIEESQKVAAANIETGFDDATGEREAATKEVCGKLDNTSANTVKGVTEALDEKLGMREATAEAFRPMLLDATQRIVNKEVKALGAAWKRHGKNGTPETFLAWVEKFYGEQKDAARTAVLPVLQSYGEVLGSPEKQAEVQAQLFAWQYTSEGLASVRDFFSEAPERLPEELSKWQESKAEELAAGLLAKITDGSE